MTMVRHKGHVGTLVRVMKTNAFPFSQAWKRSPTTAQCVTFCKATFVSKVDPCGRAVDAGQRQLRKAEFISPYHTLKNTELGYWCLNLY